jgi:hypothetical protein
MKRLIIILALLTSACAPLRHATRPLQPSADCARRTLLVELHLDCPRAFWSLQGNTYVATCAPGMKAAWVAPDPVWRDCQ